VLVPGRGIGKKKKNDEKSIVANLWDSKVGSRPKTNLDFRGGKRVGGISSGRNALDGKRPEGMEETRNGEGREDLGVICAYSSARRSQTRVQVSGLGNRKTGSLLARASAKRRKSEATASSEEKKRMKTQESTASRKIGQPHLLNRTK